MYLCTMIFRYSQLPKKALLKINITNLKNQENQQIRLIVFQNKFSQIKKIFRYIFQEHTQTYRPRAPSTAPQQ